MATRTTRFVPDVIDEDDRPYLKSPFEYEQTAQAGQLLVSVQEQHSGSKIIRAVNTRVVSPTALELHIHAR